MQDATPNDILLHTLQCALKAIPPGSGNRRSVMQTLRYAERSRATSDIGQRRALLRLAAAHLRTADKDSEFADELSALGDARRAMTVALFECSAGLLTDHWRLPQVEVRYVRQDSAAH
jgi:hypothetical protein